MRTGADDSRVGHLVGVQCVGECFGLTGMVEVAVHRRCGPRREHLVDGVRVVAMARHALRVAQMATRDGDICAVGGPAVPTTQHVVDLLEKPGRHVVGVVRPHDVGVCVGWWVQRVGGGVLTHGTT